MWVDELKKNDKVFIEQEQYLTLATVEKRTRTYIVVFGERYSTRTLYRTTHPTAYAGKLVEYGPNLAAYNHQQSLNTATKLIQKLQTRYRRFNQKRLDILNDFIEQICEE